MCYSVTILINEDLWKCVWHQKSSFVYLIRYRCFESEVLEFKLKSIGNRNSRVLSLPWIFFSF